MLVLFERDIAFARRFAQVGFRLPEPVAQVGDRPLRQVRAHGQRTDSLSDSRRRIFDRRLYRVVERAPERISVEDDRRRGGRPFKFDPAIDNASAEREIVSADKDHRFAIRETIDLTRSTVGVGNIGAKLRRCISQCFQHVADVAPNVLMVLAGQPRDFETRHGRNAVDDRERKRRDRLCRLFIRRRNDRRHGRGLRRVALEGNRKAIRRVGGIPAARKSRNEKLGARADDTILIAGTDGRAILRGRLDDLADLVGD